MLLQSLRIGPFASRPLFSAGNPPQVTAAEGEVERRGPCVVFQPAGAPSSVEVEASDDVVVRTRGTADAEYRLRSFADTPPTAPHGTLAAGSTQTPARARRASASLAPEGTAHGPVDLCTAA